jgi:hypothetical protein
MALDTNNKFARLKSELENPIPEVVTLATVNQSVKTGTSVNETQTETIEEVAAAGAQEVTLQQVRDKIPAVGQQPMAASLPVVIASDQSDVPISASTLPLPTNAATESTLGTLLTEVEFEARINTLGQKAMVASTPVVIASDQSPVPISGTITATVTDVGVRNVADVRINPSTAERQDTATAILTTIDADTGSIDSKLNTLGQKAMVGSVPVVISSDQSALPVSGTISVSQDKSTNELFSTASVSNVDSEVLAANSDRKMVAIFNDSGAVVYFKYGAAATTTSFSFRMANNEYYEFPQPVYTGSLHAIRGAGSGNVHITEFE